KQPRAWERCRLQLERLEDRLAPTIDIFAGASGSQAQDAAFVKANGVISASAASLSTGALQAIGANNNISITATAGDIVFHANLGTVNLLQTGGTDAFTATAGAITFTTPTDTLATAGAGFNLSAGTNLSTAGLRTGAGDIAIRSVGDLSAGTLSAPSGTV